MSVYLCMLLFCFIFNFQLIQAHFSFEWASNNIVNPPILSFKKKQNQCQKPSSSSNAPLGFSSLELFKICHRLGPTIRHGQILFWELPPAFLSCAGGIWLRGSIPPLSLVFSFVSWYFPKSEFCSSWTQGSFLCKTAVSGWKPVAAIPGHSAFYFCQRHLYSVGFLACEWLK